MQPFSSKPHKNHLSIYIGCKNHLIVETKLVYLLQPI